VLKGLKIAHLLRVSRCKAEGILTVGIARNRTPRALWLHAEPTADTKVMSGTRGLQFKPGV
jgi:hypothetical protein